MKTTPKSGRGLPQSKTLARLLGVLLLCSGVVLASNVYLFNPTSYPVTNAGVAVISSADTLRYLGATNAIINPVMPTNDIGYTKASNGVVAPMTAAEISSITNFIATNATAQARAGGVSEYDGTDQLARLLKAIVELIVDQLNQVRTNTNAQAAITYSQARTAITNKLANDP